MQNFIKLALNIDSLRTPSRGIAMISGAMLAPILESLSVDTGKGWLYLLLLSIIGADWITGIAAAKKDGTYASEYGRAGVLRTTLLLWLPIVGVLADKALYSVLGVDTPGFIYYAITVGLIYHSWESMTANSYRAGWARWIPEKVIKYVSSEIRAKAERALGKQPKGGKDENV